MTNYQQFIFESYNFDSASRTLALHFALDNELHFTESYHFDFEFADYDPAALDRACLTLFLMAGVSYYKTYVPPEIVIKQGQLDAQDAEFFSKTYQRGLGEFWYVNQLNPLTSVVFPTTTDASAVPLQTSAAGQLVAVGGGKDSLLSIELLRGQPDVATWSVGHRSQLTPLVERIGLPHYWVERTIDSQLLALNTSGAYNGHVPISALFACVGTVVATLTGKRDVVVSNEQSANEETLTYQGVSINHQYSKTQEFERDFQAYLSRNFGDSQRYYSLLRPYSELRIAELFAGDIFQKYKDDFSSCNRAFIQSSDQISWCGECSKCAFIFLALTPFIPRADVEQLWGGKNLLLDPALEPTYRQLLGIEGDKPLDCVGEVKESRSAMRLAQAIYPELTQKYQFEIPADYDFRALASDEIPADIKSILTA